MNLRIKKVNRKNKDKKKIKELFKASFPKEERIPFWLMYIMTKISSTELLSFYDENIFCGFIYMATIDKITFIIYLVVEEDIRSKGYGSAVLNEIQSMYEDNKLIVYIDIADEAQDSDQRLKRKKFYINNGYKETNYLVNSTKDVIQEILIKNGEFDEKEFTQFFKKYTNGIMKPKIFKK